MAVVSDYTALLSKFYWTGDSEAGQSAFVTYSFPSSAPSHLSSEFSASAVASWEAFTATQQGWAETAIAALEAVTGLNFLEVDSGGDVNFQWINFDLTGNSGFAGFAYYPSLYGGTVDTETVTDLSGDIFLNTETSASATSWLETLIHELGHAVGLKHPFEGSSENPDTLITSLDNEEQTVMSYTSVSGFTADHYGPLDEDALQDIYGTSGAFGSHLASWSWDAAGDTLTQNGTSGADNILGISHDDIIKGAGGADTLIGFAGDDFLSGQGGNDYAGGGEGDDQIFMGSGADSVEGGEGADEIGGGDGVDTLEGDAGNDTLYGGSGDDSLVPGEGNDVTWAGSGNDEITEYSNHSTADTLGGGAGNDTVYGGGGADIVYGGQGTASTNGDYVSAGGGADTTYGGNGTDTIFGGDGNDLIFGGSGDDSLSGQDGSDEIWGGSGDDTMWGGSGSNIFGFIAGSGDDQIGDFDASTDQIDLSGYGISSSTVLANLNDFGSSIELVLNGGDTIFLFGVTSSEFTSSNILV